MSLTAIAEIIDATIRCRYVPPSNYEIAHKNCDAVVIQPSGVSVSGLELAANGTLDQKLNLIHAKVREACKGFPLLDDTTEPKP